jgi:hypothetical protein
MRFATTAAGAFLAGGFCLDGGPTVAFVAQGPRSGPAAFPAVPPLGDRKHGKLNRLSRAVKGAARRKSRKAGERALRYLSYPCAPTVRRESATTL